MTTRKQAARERKRRVHGWEGEPLAGPNDPVAKSVKASGKSGGGGRRVYRDGDVIVSGRRRISPPTWRRTLLRTAIFLPFMWVIVHFMFSGDLSVRDEATLIVMYAFVTIAVMHGSETFTYRRLDRKLTEQGSPRR